LKNFPKVIWHPNKLSYSELFKSQLKSGDSNNPSCYLPFVEELCYEPNSNESLKLLFWADQSKGEQMLLQALAIAVEQNKNIHLSICQVNQQHDNLDKYQKLITSLDLETFNG
jgi:hypothetical protein